MSKTIHGHAIRDTFSPTYSSWCNMVRRCTNPGAGAYPRYGAKGVTVCERWLTFENFLADMGLRPPKHSIDRFPDMSGNYEPGNCRWATANDQQRNIKSNRNITHDGRTQCLSAWALECGLSPRHLSWRLAQGWTMHEAMNTVPKLGNRLRPTGWVMLEHRGVQRSIAGWARETMLSPSLIRLRLSKGMSIAETLTTPKGKWNQKGDHNGS